MFANRKRILIEFGDCDPALESNQLWAGKKSDTLMPVFGKMQSHPGIASGMRVRGSRPWGGVMCIAAT